MALASLSLVVRMQWLALALVPFLAACGAGPTASQGGVQSTRIARVPPTSPQRPVQGFRAAKVMNLPGLEAIIGNNAAGLARQLGEPRLDVIEGDARKLQFTGKACVLDVYLYPSRPGAEPTAAYVDARRESDGLDVDRAACVAALGKR